MKILILFSILLMSSYLFAQVDTSSTSLEKKHLLEKVNKKAKQDKIIHDTILGVIADDQEQENLKAEYEKGLEVTGCHRVSKVEIVCPDGHYKLDASINQYEGITKDHTEVKKKLKVSGQKASDQ
jgi:hypothetical protein